MIGIYINFSSKVTHQPRNLNFPNPDDRNLHQKKFSYDQVPMSLKMSTFSADILFCYNHLSNDVLYVQETAQQDLLLLCNGCTCLLVLFLQEFQLILVHLGIIGVGPNVEGNTSGPNNADSN